MAEVPVSADELLPPDRVQNAAGDSIELAGPTVKRGFQADELLIGAGWLGTGLALYVNETPFQLLLMDQLKLPAAQIAMFTFIGSIPIYIKPFAGILSDAVPLCGTRRRHYLLYGLVLAAASFLLLGNVSRDYSVLLPIFFLLNIFLTLNSTVLGGLMVEVGKRDSSTGRLSAQRVGITKVTEMTGYALTGLLSTLAYQVTTLISAVLNFLLFPLFLRHLKEQPTARRDTQALREVGRQLVNVVQSRTLWAAAGLVVLVIIAPGFHTPLLFFQKKVLGFDNTQVGILKALAAVGGVIGAFIYGKACRGLNLRTILAWSILLHTIAIPFYLFYRSWETAIAITLFEGITGVIALLPLYDLAARATPRGSEALGYCVMMSVWNFTYKLSDYLGSVIYSEMGLTFNHLVWVNTATTAVVLVAVPFLPAALMNRKDGEADPDALEAPH